MKERTLFLSFTGLRRLVRERKVSQKELDTGLFFFGCTRNNVFNADGESCALVIGRAPEEDTALETVQQAVLLAETAEVSRAEFRPSGGIHTFSMLYDFLGRNGLDLSLSLESIPQGVAEAMEITNAGAEDVKGSGTLRELVEYIDRWTIFKYDHSLVRMLFGHLVNIRS